MQPVTRPSIARQTSYASGQTATLKTDADELALIAQEIGAEVIRGPVRYPGKLGDIEVGGVDIVWGVPTWPIAHHLPHVRIGREEWKHGDFSALL